MRISHNFVSLVAIGNFNPAIITPDFLNRICKLDLGEPKEISPLDVPVLRHLKFNHLELIVELTRLTIKESGIQDISDSKIISIFQAYYKKLPYTPLTAVGINISCELAPNEDDGKISLVKRLQEPNTYLSFFHSDEIEITERAVYGKSRDKKWTGSDVTIPNVDKLTRRISVLETKTSLFQLNYNCEAGNLTHALSKLDELLNRYGKFCDEFLEFVKYLET